MPLDYIVLGRTLKEAEEFVQRYYLNNTKIASTRSFMGCRGVRANQILVLPGVPNYIKCAVSECAAYSPMDEKIIMVK